MLSRISYLLWKPHPSTPNQKKELFLKRIKFWDKGEVHVKEFISSLIYTYFIWNCHCCELSVASHAKYLATRCNTGKKIPNIHLNMSKHVLSAVLGLTAGKVSLQFGTEDRRIFLRTPATIASMHWNSVKLNIVYDFQLRLNIYWCQNCKCNITTRIVTGDKITTLTRNLCSLSLSQTRLQNINKII